MKRLILVGLVTTLDILGTGCSPQTSAIVLDLLAERAAAPRPGLLAGSAIGGMPVYGASQCVGPVIMGVCQGSVIGPPAPRCYGTMLNGQCTGPMFQDGRPGDLSREGAPMTPLLGYFVRCLACGTMSEVAFVLCRRNGGRSYDFGPPPTICGHCGHKGVVTMARYKPEEEPR